MLKSILTGYIDMALARAEYDKLEDGTFSGRIPVIDGFDLNKEPVYESVAGNFGCLTFVL